VDDDCTCGTTKVGLRYEPHEERPAQSLVLRFPQRSTGLWESMWTVVGVGVAMLMEDLFDAVNRAFTKKVDRIPLPSRPNLKSPLELPLQAPKSSQALAASDRRRLPERRLPQG